MYRINAILFAISGIAVALVMARFLTTPPVPKPDPYVSKPYRVDTKPSRPLHSP